MICSEIMRLTNFIRLFVIFFLIILASFNLSAFPKKKHSIIKDKLSKQSYEELFEFGYYSGFLEWCNYAGVDDKKYIKGIKGAIAYTNWDLFLKFNLGYQQVEGDLYIAGIGYSGPGGFQEKPIEWKFELSGCNESKSLQRAIDKLSSVPEEVILKFIYEINANEYQNNLELLLTALKEDKKDDYSSIIEVINLKINNTDVVENNSKKNNLDLQEEDSISNSDEALEIKTDDEIKFFGSGTGFFVSNKGFIVTNNHVVNGCEYVTYNDEILEFLHNDTFNDLAILKSNNKTENFISVSDRITPAKGQSIFVLGYPFGKITSSESKVTAGIISSLQGLGNNYSQIQIDAAIQPGNSGGPVFDNKGELIGITVATADYKYFEDNYGVLPQNMNFAIKSLVLRNFLESVNIEIQNNISMKNMTQVEIVKAYDKATIYLECWSTDAKVALANKGINVLVDTARKFIKP